MTNGISPQNVRPDSGIRGASGSGKATNMGATVRRLFGYLRPYTVKLILVALVTVVSTVFAVISPKMLGGITTSLLETVTEGKALDLAWIFQLLAILALLYLISFFCDFIRVHIMVGMTQTVIRRLRAEVDRKFARLPLQYYDTHRTGDIMSRATNDIDLVSQTLQSTLSEIVAAAVTLIGVTAMMLTISPILTIICLLTLPAGTIINGLIVRASQKYFKQQSQYLGQLNAHVEESFTGHRIVKAFGQEEESIRKFEEMNNRLFHAATRAQFASGTSYPLNGIVTDLAYIAICFLGCTGVIHGTMTLGDVQALILYSQKFATPVSVLSNLVSTIQSAVAGAERVFELLDEPEEVEDQPATQLPDSTGEICFRDVSFSYTPEQPLIEHFNLTVRPGESVAIVGHTGAGKTTLVNLLMRFYEIQAGAITLGGVDIREIPREELRKRFGMVLQDAWLFEGTIRENIAYGAEDPSSVTDANIETAARAARLHHTIQTMPDGYATQLEDGAGNLSSGQRQLLTIARAVVSQPQILILDEATSSVDTRTEQQIQLAMENVMRDRMSFIIAHRLSTIRHAKTILVMQDGHIAEQGSHDELMQKRGAYYELYRAQFMAPTEKS